MSIRIAGRLHPFSHLPGTVCLLPQTHLTLRIYPTRIDFFHESNASLLFSLTLEIQGPMEEFTVEVDLEHPGIRVFGMTPSGYLRYSIRRQIDGIALIMEKLPQSKLICHLSQHEQPCALVRGETLLISRTFSEEVPLATPERLSLGMHKMQDWDLVKRRADLKEIIPIWLRLGQITPKLSKSSPTRGNLSLLEQCGHLIKENRKLEILPAFMRLFLAGLEGICVPRLWDTDYQGIVPSQKPQEGDPSALSILTEGAELLRSIFLREEGDALSILPSLPADLHSGRMIQAQTHFGDRVDFEWSKKQLRRLILHPFSQRQMHLQLPRHLHSCRVCTSVKEKGKEHALKEGMLLLSIDPKHTIFIDRFQK